MVPKEAKNLVSKCIFCGANPDIELYNVFDTSFGIKDKYKIGRCASCRTEQILPLPSRKQLKELYETYYNFGEEKDTAYTGFREYFFSSVLYPFWLIVDGSFSFMCKKALGACWIWDVMKGEGCEFTNKIDFWQKGWN